MEMKDLFFYKGGLCIRYSDEKSKFHSIRVEHNSLREFVFAYVSQPRDGTQVLNMMVEHIKKNQLSKLDNPVNSSDYGEQLKQKPQGFDRPFKVSKSFLRLLGLPEDQDPVWRSMFDPLFKYIMEHCARILDFDQLKDADTKYIGKIIPDGNLFEFLPPDMEIPFRFVHINKIISYQIKIAKEPERPERPEVPKVPVKLVPLQYSIASMDIEEEPKVENFDKWGRKNYLMGRFRQWEYPKVEYTSDGKGGEGTYWYQGKPGYLVKCYTRDTLVSYGGADLLPVCPARNTYWVPLKDLRCQGNSDCLGTWSFITNDLLNGHVNWSAWTYTKRRNGTFRPSNPFMCDTRYKHLKIYEGVLTLFVLPYTHIVPSIENMDFLSNYILVHLKRYCRHTNDIVYCHPVLLKKGLPLNKKFFNVDVVEEIRIKPMRLDYIDIDKTPEELELQHGDILIYRYKDDGEKDTSESQLLENMQKCFGRSLE